MRVALYARYLTPPTVNPGAVSDTDQPVSPGSRRGSDIRRAAARRSRVIVVAPTGRVAHFGRQTLRTRRTRNVAVRPTAAPRVEIVSLGRDVVPLIRAAMRTSSGKVGVEYSGTEAPVTNCHSRWIV